VIGDVLHIRFHANAELVSGPHGESCARIHREIRPYAAGSEVDLIDNRGAALRESLLLSAIKRDGKPRRVFASACHPQPRRELIMETSSCGVALILRRPQPACLIQRIGGIHTEKEAARHGQIDRTHEIRISHVPAEPSPAGEVQLRLRPVDISALRKAIGKLTEVLSKGSSSAKLLTRRRK